MPHLDWLTVAYGVPLAFAGFAVSCVMLPSALAGWTFGAIVDRFGARRVALCGLCLSAAASLIAAAELPFAALVLVRVVEGIGYTLLVISATVLAVQLLPSHSALALSVWSSFAPIGFALGQWGASYAASDRPLLSVGVTHAAVLALAAAALGVFLHKDVRTERKPFGAAVLRFQPAQRTALAFGGSCAALLAAVALAPIVLAASTGLGVAYVASLTALAALPSIVGRIFPGWAMQRGVPAFKLFLWSTVVAALSLAGALLAPLPLAGALVLVAVFQISAGALPGILSAMMPHVSPSPDQLGTVSGMCSQVVNMGNLAGPPLALAVYAVAGTGAAVALLVVLLALSLGAVARVPVYRRDLRRPGGQAA